MVKRTRAVVVAGGADTRVEERRSVFSTVSAECSHVGRHFSGTSRLATADVLMRALHIKTKYARSVQATKGIWDR